MSAAEEITLQRALELGCALEVLIVPGVARATGYLGRREGTERVELGSRILEHGWDRRGGWAVGR